MGNNNFVLKGNICYSQEINKLETIENGYLVCIDGKSAGVFRTCPTEYSNLPVTDYGDKLIIPGLVDLHIHASQYAFRGLGMDLELLDWLNEKTFPEEAKFADLDYAKRAYSIFAENLKQGAVTRACIFATIHSPATELLMDYMEETGLKTMIGKVNMDRNSPESLIEGTAGSAEDTIHLLEKIKGNYRNVEPILTPRFIPTCSDELMGRLKEIQSQYGLAVQSHLSENLGEVQWVSELSKDSKFYGDAYDRFGLFGGDCKTVMAHCVHSGEPERRLMKERGVFVAHCPQSNTNLASGVAPIRRFLEEGVSVGLGSDVAGGSSDSIFRAMTDAVQVSKLRWRLADDNCKPLAIEEAFYLGTKGGAAFFGKTGSFEAGYELDAVILDDSALKHPQPLSLKERLERFIYLSDDRHIFGKYVSGAKVL